ELLGVALFGIGEVLDAGEGVGALGGLFRGALGAEGVEVFLGGDALGGGGEAHGELGHGLLEDLGIDLARGGCGLGGGIFDVVVVIILGLVRDDGIGALGSRAERPGGLGGPLGARGLVDRL